VLQSASLFRVSRNAVSADKFHASVNDKEPVERVTIILQHGNKKPSRLRRDGSTIVFSCERSTKTKAGGCLANLLFFLVNVAEFIIRLTEPGLIVIKKLHTGCPLVYGYDLLHGFVFRVPDDLVPESL
jgi:hypothetical protein